MRIEDRRIDVELALHRIELKRVEIPAERAADEAAEQRAEQIDAPARQPTAPAREDGRKIGQEIDTGIGGRARKRAEQETIAAEPRRRAERRAEPDRRADGKPAQIVRGALIFAHETAPEGGRRIRALHDSAAERIENSADDRSAEHAGRNEGVEQLCILCEGADRADQQHEDEAVDGALARARRPRLAHGRLDRRLAVQQVGHGLRDQIGLAPQARLRDGGHHGREENAERRRQVLSELQRPVGRDVRREGREDRRAEQHGVQARATLRFAAERDRGAGDDGLVEQNEDRRAADRGDDEIVERRVEGQLASEVGRKIGADGEKQAEDEGNERESAVGRRLRPAA